MRSQLPTVFVAITRGTRHDQRCVRLNLLERFNQHVTALLRRETTEKQYIPAGPQPPFKDFARLRAITQNAPVGHIDGFCPMLLTISLLQRIPTCVFYASASCASLRARSGRIEQLNYILEMISEVPSMRVLNSNGQNLLTPREEQVVALVAEGLGNRQIAIELNLSEHTVKKYLFRIFEKLGISTRVELVLYAVNNGDPRQAEWLMGSNRIAPIA